VGFPLPHLQRPGCPDLFARCLFCHCLFSFFSLFSLGGDWSVQGVMLIWPRVICGSTMCRLAHLVVGLPKRSGSWRLAAREPSWFLHLTLSGDAMCMLGVWEESKFCLFSVFFPIRCISSVSPRFYFRKHAFCLLPLVTILESSFLAFCYV
jgi:hypothetical protein